MEGIQAISIGYDKCHEKGAAAGTLEKAPKPQKNFLKKMVFKLRASAILATYSVFLGLSQVYMVYT